MPQEERPARPGTSRPTTRDRVATTGIALGGAVALFLLWYVGGAILVIFAGILLASGLDGAVSGLRTLVPLGRGWRFAVVLVLFAAALGGLVSFGGAFAVQQMADLLATIERELSRSRSFLADSGLGQYFGTGDEPLAPLLPDPAGMLSSARTAVTGIFGMIGSGVLIIMLGIFFAYEPRRYREGVVRLLPPARRERVRAVLDEAGETLRWWILGILINMAAIAVFTTLGLVLIGVPHAVALGVQAGVLAFIPTVGPLLAAIPIILVSLGEGYATVVWALGLYAAVQALESNVLTPLVQMEMVSLYPGTILVVQLIMLTLFGPAGLALATPLAAVAKVMVKRLYVEAVLEGDAPEG